ncbi:MAG: arylformamidase [Cognaticolwellia sp.]|jgi:arylformamidase
MRILDISPTLRPAIAVWPGDTGFSRDVALSFEKGDNLVLSGITTTLHVGAHTDAPNHYAPAGQGIHERSLERYLGPCQVMAVDCEMGTRIQVSDLKVPVQAPRVLFKTGSFPDPDHFNTDFCSLSPELVDHLAQAGVVLVGLDTPSVDPADSKALEAHNAIHRADMGILEGVVLEAIEPGVYTLIALPLKIEGGDASPVRAVLVEGDLG